jgi:hypothetical protein
MKQMMASTDDKQERMAINLKEMEADRNGDWENLKGMMAEMNTKMDGNEAEMRSTICAFQSELRRPSNMKWKP